jgi:uncharacterized membrane protein
MSFVINFMILVDFSYSNNKLDKSNYMSILVNIVGYVIMAASTFILIFWSLTSLKLIILIEDLKFKKAHAETKPKFY